MTVRAIVEGIQNIWHECKPCPFCGGVDLCFTDSMCERASVHVDCNGCGICGPGALTGNEGRRPRLAGRSHFTPREVRWIECAKHAEARAADRWNTRS